MNLRDILFAELISVEKTQKKLSERRRELRKLLHLGKDRREEKFTNRDNSKQLTSKS